MQPGSGALGTQGNFPGGLVSLFLTSQASYFLPDVYTWNSTLVPSKKLQTLLVAFAQDSVSF